MFYLGVSVGSSFPHAFGGESAAIAAAKIGMDPRLPNGTNFVNSEEGIVD